MLSKILLTVAIVIGALIFLRMQGQRSAPAAQRAAPPPVNLKQRNLITGIILLVLLSLGAGAYYLNWSEAHRTVTVRVIHATSGKAQEYEVYAKQIEGRSFVTVDGRTITVADSERLEVRQ